MLIGCFNCDARYYVLDFVYVCLICVCLLVCLVLDCLFVCDVG